MSNTYISPTEVRIRCLENVVQALADRAADIDCKLDQILERLAAMFVDLPWYNTHQAWLKLAAWGIEKTEGHLRRLTTDRLDDAGNLVEPARIKAVRIPHENGSDQHAKVLIEHPELWRYATHAAAIEKIADPKTGKVDY